MGYVENKKYIIGKLKEKVRIAVEYDGYESDDPASAFDAHEDTELLESFGEFERKVDIASKEGMDRGDLLKDVRKQVEEIKSVLDDYADKLAKNAELSSTDVTQANPKVFDRHAKAFEKVYKSKLRIVSNDDWLS